MSGTRPSDGWVHGLLERAARAVGAANTAIRALIILARVVCGDDTPLRAGPGPKTAKKYLQVACTSLLTYYFPGGRDLASFRQFVYSDVYRDGPREHGRGAGHGGVRDAVFGRAGGGGPAGGGAGGGLRALERHDAVEAAVRGEFPHPGFLTRASSPRRISDAVKRASAGGTARHLSATVDQSGTARRLSAT